MTSRMRYLGKVIFRTMSLAFVVPIQAGRWARLSLIWNIQKPKYLGACIRSRSIGGHVTIGLSAEIGPDCMIECSTGASLSVGSGCSINQGTFVAVRSSVVIGNDVRIGEYCSIRDHDHAWEDKNVSIKNQGYTTKRVIIGSDVWIGRGAVIGKGVTIGDGAVVGANAVVTKDVDAYSVVAGVPAKVISRRS